MKEKIGINAGILWNALENQGAQNLKDVKKATKLTDKDLYAAIGWLAREDKITVNEENKEVFIAIV